MVPALSVTVTVTGRHPGVGVAVIVPVVGGSSGRAGRPVADQVRVAVDEVSVAGHGDRVDRHADPSDWSPGPVTVTVLVTVQVNVAEPV